MKKNRWFNWIIAGILIGMAALTVHQIDATAQVISTNAGQTAMAAGTDPVQSDPMACPFTAEQIHSIHSAYVKEIGHTFSFTKDGPTGVEGGLYMLRYCKAP